MMKIHRWPGNGHFPCVPGVGLVIGNFDGVHLGHQKMIRRLREVCDLHGLRAVGMSFYPHPRARIDHHEPALLSPLRDRAYWLGHYGLGDWLLISFISRFRQLPPERFVREYLIDGLAVRYLLVGDDFRFGYQGRGDFSLLQAMAEEGGFQVEALSSVTDRNGQRISSSRIRNALASGDLPAATQWLGHPLTFTGRVRHGAARGRKLAARTANVHLPMHWCLPNGVYVVKLRVCNAGSAQYWGVDNVGTSPTFGGTRRKLEVHLLDANLALYDALVQVSVVAFVREEKRFDLPEQLQAQIQQDILFARQVISREIPII